MSGLARILAARGLDVSGSDAKRTKNTAKLEAEGIRVVIGHTGSFEEHPDFIVVSSAISKNNPDYRQAEVLGIPIFHRAEVLSFFMNQAISLAVAGAHGKTTSSAFASFLMTQAGFRPTCLVGGEILNYGSNAVIGNSHLFVAEVDESDRSQLYFSPDFVLITNLDREHLDVYKDINDIKDSFKRFIQQVKTTGKIVYCAEDPYLKEIVSEMPTNTISYGFNSECDFRAEEICLEPFSSRYVLMEQGRKIDEVLLKIPGMHNVLNSLGVIALIRSFGARYDQFLRATSEFRGTGRRFEVKLNRQDWLVIDDYAHHPTEVSATLKAVRNIGRKTTVVFQPHRFSRTFLLAKEFSHAFQSADRVLLTDIYSAGEENPDHITANLIYEEVKKSGHPNVQMIGRDDLIHFLISRHEGEETVAFLGAGDIGEIADEFAGRFENVYTH